MIHDTKAKPLARPAGQATLKAIKPGSQGLGWFLRRSRNPGQLGQFYERGLGLPRMRSWDMPQTAGVMLWCGDVGVVELNRLDARTELNPSQSPCLPVFGSLDPEHSFQRAVEAGAHPVADAFPDRFDIQGLKDPDGFLFGIEQMERGAKGNSSTNSMGWPGSVSNLPGGICIDGPIQCITKVIHKSAAPLEERDFLSKLGFEVSSASTISLGGVTEIVLEQSSSLKVPTALANREMAHDTWIARVYGLESYRNALLSRDGKLLSSHEFAGGVLDYALSPSNILIGWQERKAYDPDVPTTQMIEDIAARTHWLNRFGASAE